MLQQILVIVIVAAAAIFAAWRLPGTSTRLKYAAGLKRVGFIRFGAWLEARLMRGVAAGGCNACGVATRKTVHQKKGATREGRP